MLSLGQDISYRRVSQKPFEMTYPVDRNGVVALQEVSISVQTQRRTCRMRDSSVEISIPEGTGGNRDEIYT